MMDAVISSTKLKIESGSDPAKGSDSSTVALFQRKIEFHKARKPFDGFASNGGASFKIETLNPSGSDHRRQTGNSAAAGGGVGGRKGDGSGFMENGLDPELSIGITFRRIGAGLENLGNTCFLNSVLQCLTYTEPLAAYLQSGKHKNSCHIAGFCALCAIQKHVSRALQLTGRSLAPKDLVSNLRCISRNFRNARQEDAHEYMVNLLESMHKCCLPSGVPSESPGAYEKSLVHKIFGGRLRSQVKCMQCSYHSNKFDPFLDLSLEIFKADSLHKALLNFTAAELLDGGEKQYQCQRCKQKVRALKQLTVYKAPHVLTIHLKRFRSHDGQKIDKKVVFGPTLDMKPFVSGSDEADLKYTLYGVLVHYGWSTHSGHYSCFVRTSSGMWYSLDDSRVGQVSERTVLDQKAYMLFYVRDRKTFVPRKSVDILQKEHLKADVNGKKICPIMDQYSKEHAPNGSMENRLHVADSFNARKDAACNGSSKEIPVKEASLSPNNKGPMAECSMPKRDPKVEPALSAPLPKNPSGLSNKIPDLGGHKPSSVLSINRNGPNTENAATTADSKVNGRQENGISKRNLGVPITGPPSSNCPKNTAHDKLDIGGTSQKINIISHDEVSRSALSGDSGAKSEERLPCSAPSANTVQVGLLNKSTCDQAGGICSTSASENLVNEMVVGIGRNVVLESVELSAPSVMTNESSDIKAKDGVAHRKLKTKSLKRHITSMHVGLKLFKSSLGMRKKKKHKRTKHRTLNTQNISQNLLDEYCVSSDLGPSTSEKSLTNSLVSSRSRMDLCKRTATNGDGGSLINTIDGDFGERQNQSGIVLATKQLQPCSSSVVETKQQNAREPSCSMDGKLNGTARKLTRDLEETVVARWDDLELPPAVEVTESTSIGYVLDDWDEEYDQGKRKKRRQPKLSFDGSNPFQEISTKRSQFTKAKMDRTSSCNQPFRI